MNAQYSRSVDRFIEALPPEQAAIAQGLREIIHDTLPEVEEAIKWQVPFFAHHGNLCYLNPRGQKVILGLMEGASLPDPGGRLAASNRKQVRHLIFLSSDRDPWDDLPFFLQEAAILNQSKRKNYDSENIIRNFSYLIFD